MATLKIPVRAQFGSLDEKLKTEVENYFVDHPIESTLVNSLCRPFETSGSVVTCRPVEGYSLGVTSHFEPVQEGSGDPTPDNIRPITGRTAVNLTRLSGKNLFGGDALADKIASLGGTKDAANGTITFHPGSMNGRSLFNKFKENTQYTIILYGRNTETSIYVNIYIYYTDGTADRIMFTRPKVDEYVIKTSAAGKTISSLRVLYMSGITCLYYNQCGVFEGVVSQEEFEPYRGETFAAELGQTVYGGSLDWSTGLLTISWGEVILDEKLSWTGSNREDLGLYQAMTKNTVAIPGSTGYCDKFGSTSGNKNRFYIGGDFNFYTNHAATIEEWTAFIKDNPLQVVYQLREPITIQLTAQEIAALSGTNTLYSDTGDTTVSGKADYTHKLTNLLDRVAALETSAVNNV